MQEAILKDLGLSPVEKEVVVLYKGEKETTPPEFWEVSYHFSSLIIIELLHVLMLRIFQGKRIVELPKERPPWFSRNLLQRSTTTTSDQTDVQPDKLA